jgi:iron complex outermembrane receptor protein
MEIQTLVRNPKTVLQQGGSLLVIGAGLAFAAPAAAQNADAAADAAPADANTIIVTARKQDETLQDVPVAVSVLSAETLDSFRVDEAADIVSRVPALTVQIGGSGASGSVSLRGVGSSSISNAFDSAVAINVDGVSVSTQRLLQTAFFDVEQIEVLKGPQSLFFGKAASAGVLSLKSANPTPNWEVSGTASYEFEEKGYTVGGYISGPLTDTFGIRVAAEYQDISKFVEIDDGVPSLDPDKGLTNFIGRVTLDFEPSDSFNANLKLNYNAQRSETLSAFTDIFCGADGLPDPSVLAVFGLTFAPTHDCNFNDSRFPTPDGLASINVVPTGTVGADRADITQAFNDTDLFFARLQMDLALSDTLTVSSLTGYVDMDNEYNDSFNTTGQNPDGSAAGFTAPFRNTVEQFTQELRLTSDFGGPFNFMIGAFYEDRKVGLQTSQNAFLPSAVLGPDAITGFTFDWFADRPITSEAFSLFASAIVDLSDQWELSGGLRWTDEEKSSTINFPYVHSFITGAFGAVSSGFSSPPVFFNDSNISPEVVLKYSATDDLNIYAAFKTGFKSGGVDNNILPTGSIVPGLVSGDPAVVEASGDALRFDSETSIGGEIGMRAQFANRAFTLNPTFYYYVYENLQLQIFDPTIFNFNTTNAGELTTFGLDVEWAWATPVEGLTFTGAFGYLDAEFTAPFIASDTLLNDLEGRRPSRAPEFSGNLAVDFKTMMSDTLEFGLNGNIAYSGSYFTSTDSSEAFDPVTAPTGSLVQDSFVTLDGTISVGDPDGKWTLSLIGVNLTDEQIIQQSGPTAFRAGGDDITVFLNRGRQVFVEVGFKF